MNKNNIDNILNEFIAYAGEDNLYSETGKEIVLIELNDMKEWANTPGCMYCLPKWVGGTAYLLYFVSIVVLAISITCFIKAKTKKL